MEQNLQKPNFAKGIYLTKKQGKNGEYLELALKDENSYKKYVCFLSKKKDKAFLMPPPVPRISFSLKILIS